MHFTTRQDIEAPLDFVDAYLMEFDHFERMAMRRGAEVERTDRLRSPGPGMAWRLRFAYRGKPRRMTVRLEELQPGSLLVYGLESPSLDGQMRVELIALSPRRSRITVMTEVRPRTLAARLLLQSMRLARGRLQRRLDVTAGRLAGLIEERWRAEQRSRG
ncbi:SRPBCC family protein [Rhodobacter sp. Har01]|uniref:SRPBCC family protein n=1 Tax=Rhodobacter sp. Har01 TaxID=2883999 RepID=UPI001D08BECA|nr:SRPBCC family protein [Rhodobacter sp. Har01]MCB6179554.1 SRPBCC family protein [Rhodobacter sp. Har01]